MTASTDWMAVRGRLADILYNSAPLSDRLEVLRAELSQIEHGLHVPYLELDSMTRSAAENREAPFLDVGKELLTYCDSHFYRQMEIRGEDPRWLPDLRRHEQEQADELRRRQETPESFY